MGEMWNKVIIEHDKDCKIMKVKKIKVKVLLYWNIMIYCILHLKRGQGPKV